MLKFINRQMLVASASIVVGLTAAKSAQAGSNNFSSIAKNITESVSDLPTLLAALSYLGGLLFAVLGIMKIKDHVEQPTQHPLSHGAIRLGAGGALFALPIIMEAALNTIGDGNAVSQAALQELTF